jgi:transcriptional regulator with XRE-family HTH domain
VLQAANVIRDARRAAGLTQARLASRLGVPQSVIARLERPGSNPTWETVSKALDACDRELSVRPRPAKASIDPTLVERQLQYTPGERLMGFERTYDEVRRMANSARRSREQVA